MAGRRPKARLAGMKRRKDNNYARPLANRGKSDGTKDNLPLVHVTAVWPAESIVTQGQLNATYCSVFKTDLLYFFVLRPAYSLKGGDKQTHKISHFPAAFILRSDAVKDPRHVYPFDTGGAAAGAFDSQADDLIPLEDYELAPTHSEASGFIEWAFGDLESYLEGRPRDGLKEEIKPREMVAVSYRDIARMGIEGSNEHDKRASAIEIAASHNVSLPGNVRLMIFPKQYLEENGPILRDIKKLRAFGAQVKTYDWQPNRAPNEFQKDIMRICRDWYRRQGILP